MRPSKRVVHSCERLKGLLRPLPNSAVLGTPGHALCMMTFFRLIPHLGMCSQRVGFGRTRGSSAAVVRLSEAQIDEEDDEEEEDVACLDSCSCT